MSARLDLHGLFEYNSTFDYSDYEYEGDCTMKRFFPATFVSVLYSVALVLGLMGNVPVMVVLWQKSRENWSLTDAFVLHLSVADVLLLLTMPLWAVDAVKGWIFSTGFCKVTGALFKINFYCSIFLLGCISLDLYLSVVHAVQMDSRTRPLQAQLICLAVWFFCLLLSIPDWLYLKAKSNLEQEDNIECVHEYPSQASCLASRLLYCVLGFLLPVILLYCCVHALLQGRSDQRASKQKAVKVFLALVLAFFISWTPYIITVLVDTFHFSCSKSPGHCEDGWWTAVKSTAVLGLLHACVNPLIYCGFSEKFRHWVLTVVTCGGCAVDSGDFFPWDSREIDEATSVPQEEKGSLHPISDIKQTITQQQNDEIL